MPQQTNYRILVKTAPAGAFSLAKVLNAPRQCTPIDIKAACSSFDLVSQSDDLPDELLSFASLVMMDFFALAHRTGLYNRQRNLWDAVGRVTEILFTRPRKGLFIKVNQPLVDMHCVDARGNTLIFGSLAEKELINTAPSSLNRFFTKALQRAGRLQKRQGVMFGVFLALPADIPQSLQATIDQMTNAEDPVARYESKLPPPLNVPLNVLKLEGDKEESGLFKLSLVHPSFRIEDAPRLVQAGSL